MILQIEDAIDRDACRGLIAVYDRYRALAQRRNHTGDPVLYCLLADIDAEARALVTNIVRDCWKNVVHGLRLSEPVYPETVILAAIGPGGYHLRHADNMRMEADGRWVPNHTPQRDFSALLYLNGDFDGGEIVFENQDIVIEPCAGLLVAFPSHQDYVHEVHPVRAGHRYSMPIWFTRQASFAMSNFTTQENEARPLECQGRASPCF